MKKAEENNFAECVDAAKDLADLFLTRTTNQAEKLFADKEQRKAYVLGAMELYQRIIMADYLFMVHQCTNESIKHIKNRMMFR